MCKCSSLGSFNFRNFGTILSSYQQKCLSSITGNPPVWRWPWGKIIKQEKGRWANNRARVSVGSIFVCACGAKTRHYTFTFLIRQKIQPRYSAFSINLHWENKFERARVDYVCSLKKSSATKHRACKHKQKHGRRWNLPQRQRRRRKVNNNCGVCIPGFLMGKRSLFVVC